MTGVADISDWVRQQVTARVPKADSDVADHEYDDLPHT